MSSALISSADASRITIPPEDEDVAALRESVIHKLTYTVGRDPVVATDWDWFMAAALAVRDHVLERWLASTRTNYITQGKRVYYLSLEFLIGRLLHDSLNNLGLVDRMRAALTELGVDTTTVCATSSMTRHWAMAASAAWPPASWRAWQHCASPRTATASATITACSAR
jgi:hypothetical protein